MLRQARHERHGGRPLKLADRSRIEAALGLGGEAPSEHCFANLYLFRERHRYRLCEAPILHLRGQTYDGLTHALPLAAVDAEAAGEIFRSGVNCLFPLGDDAPALAGRLGLVCAYVTADSDYLFNGPAIAALDHAKVRRSQARAFAEEQAPSWESFADGQREAATAVLDGWFADVGRAAERTDLAECREAIALAGAIGLEGGIVRTGTSEPVGFLLASVRTNGMRVIHFAKGRRAADGVYPWMFACYAGVTGARLLNFEQDLGNPGLAQSKRVYGPVALRPKYRLSVPSER